MSFFKISKYILTFIFYANGYNMKFKNFPNSKSGKIENLYFKNLNLSEEHFFQIEVI